METSQAPPKENNNQVRKFEENTLNSVLAKVNDFQTNGNLQLPQKYSVENALRSAWLIIQQTQDTNYKPALEVCSKESIANALLDMVLQGLSPVKKQCYFIVKGGKLTMERSYFGTIAISKRVAGVTDAIGIPVYEKDEFKYSIDLKTGIKTVTEHKQELDNIDIDKLKGAYAIVTYDDGHIEYDIMTMKQIRQSWMQGPMKGNSSAHKNFPDQMACRTVINRALKIPVNSSNDEDLYNEFTPSTIGERVEADVNHEIKISANGADGEEAIGFGNEEQKDDGNSEEIDDADVVKEQQVEKEQLVARNQNLFSDVEQPSIKTTKNRGF